MLVSHGEPQRLARLGQLFRVTSRHSGPLWTWWSLHLTRELLARGVTLGWPIEELLLLEPDADLLPVLVARSAILTDRVFSELYEEGLRFRFWTRRPEDEQLVRQLYRRRHWHLWQWISHDLALDDPNSLPVRPELPESFLTRVRWLLRDRELVALVADYHHAPEVTMLVREFRKTHLAFEAIRSD